MINLLFYITSLMFFVFITRNVLFWVYLWQIKEYRLDRLLVHLRETNQGRELLFGKKNILKIFVILIYFFTIFSSDFNFVYPFFIFFVFLISFVDTVLEIKNMKFRIPTLTAKVALILLSTFLIILMSYILPLLDRFLWLLIVEKSIPFTVAILIAFFSIPSDFYKDSTINKAIKKISEHKKLLVIGITGSYGKGSTKQYLNTILSYKYNVLQTFSTYNTPIGIAKTILLGLSAKKRIFIVEMGAYKTGEIAEMSAIVKPRIGILTAINDQHISLFKSFDNIISAKYELIDALPRDGLALFNGNNQYCYKLYKKTKKNKVLYSVNYNEEKNQTDIYASEVKVNKFSIEFKVFLKKKSIGKFEVKLIGRHNLENILPGIYIASYIGMRNDEIRQAVAKIKPFKKTMEPFVNVKKTVFIDDSYNANPAAIEAALDYMSIYKGKKVLVLQPMIELGKNAYADHYRIGVSIGRKSDLVFLTNKNYSDAITKGIRDSGGKCKMEFLSPIGIAEYIENKLGRNDIVVFEGKESNLSLSLLDYEEVF